MDTKEKKQNRIFVTHHSDYPDFRAKQLKKSIQDYFCCQVEDLKINKIYTVDKSLSPDEMAKIANNLLADPITETAASFDQERETFDWIVEVSYKNGMTDNVGRTAQTTIEDCLGKKFAFDEKVSFSTQYLVKGDISHDQIKVVAKQILANDLIEDITIKKDIETLDVSFISLDVCDESLLNISSERHLALNLEEMRAIQAYFKSPEVIAKRKDQTLSKDPTDVEIEMVAQTWSEHCKHKIFNATIEYHEEGKKEVIHSLFKTYIQKATEDLEAKSNFLVSVFTDNAGIIKFNDHYNICFKVETHNSPSALDPYGGALTGILGVNRDILGAGKGARPFANTDVFCFSPLNYKKKLPEKLLHPKRIFEGVRKGVEHGGNKSGIPTVNGAVVFDEKYVGKPLVYCGTAGIMPAKILGEGSHIKKIEPGDLIIIAGGRTGVDGIHGATFSSQELNESSPTSAVQIGDPFTQKKLQDFILEARDLGLYRTLTDNGAGGFSSSIGELAELSFGCKVYLDRALLKTTKIKPWEIFVSESQERMTLAVPEKGLEKLTELAKKHEVEICHLGEFTNSGMVHVIYHGKSVAFLSLDFLHYGLPKMHLKASWKEGGKKTFQEPVFKDYAAVIKDILSRDNVCSKEFIIRQYDHEVQGGSVLKPLVGEFLDGPGDAAVLRPLESMKTGDEGVVISCGICPKFSLSDTYHMAASAIDEAFRNYIAVGGNPSHAAILDNFCWPDPVFDSIKNPDGEYKLAQLVRATKALYDYSLSYSLPIISGKDSMKNDYRIGDVKISIPPTLLISMIGKIDTITKTVSSDFKFAGDVIYLLGETKDEMGGSELFKHFGINGGVFPKVEAKTALKLYQSLHQAILSELIVSCHDCSDGGFIVAALESAFGSCLGLSLDLRSIPSKEKLKNEVLLFSESNSRFVVSVEKKYCEEFENIMKGHFFARVGFVTEDRMVKIVGVDGQVIVSEEMKNFKEAWKMPFKKEGER